MVLSVPVIALGATLGTATSILALCGLTCLCKCKRPGKGPSDKEQDWDTENAKPNILQTVQQVKYIVEFTPLFFPRFRGTVCDNVIYSYACKVSGYRKTSGQKRDRRRRRGLRWLVGVSKQQPAFVFIKDKSQ